ncbi:MAG TPA: copper homeostasis protein CutC [Candidatus Acidoferrum sp.]|nr:copper homeostasis protein CutC [Candidatus Acidoferrum sp.]
MSNSAPGKLPKILLEIAVASLERALAAERAGAHRLELCANLEAGGLTPSLELIRKVRSAAHLPLHVLVRPRPGNFAYTADEFARMKEEIAAIRGEGVHGVVTGVLLPDGSVDKDRSRELVQLAAPLQVTFHRAFDESKNLAAALENVILTGAHRILTSGGAPDAAQGAPALRKLVQQAGKRIIIVPGGGLHAGNLADVARTTGARELHTGLGTVIPYANSDTPAFEAAVRACLASLRR